MVIRGLYIPLGNREANLSNSRMKEILAKVLKGLDKVEDCPKELRVNISVTS